MIESTAVGAAYLAGLATGVWESTDEIQRISQRIFVPTMDSSIREDHYRKWQKAVKLSRLWGQNDL